MHELKTEPKPVVEPDKKSRDRGDGPSNEFLPHRRLAEAHLPLMPTNNPRRKTAPPHTGEEPVYTSCEHRIVKRRFGSFTDDPVKAAATRALSILSFAVMCPFMIEEYYTMFTLGYEWLSIANLVDFSTHSIQTVIFICHLTNYGLADEWFALLLAFQTVLLSMRVLRFFK